MNRFQSLSNKFVVKLSFSFLVIILIIGIVYISVTFFLLDKFYSQTTQRLNANIANHLIDEKFKDKEPFLEDGSVNVELFDDIMHDMMAVNRVIEIYLLNDRGEVLHSLVLDHSKKPEIVSKVNLKPIHQFIENNQEFILGDDPKNINEEKIFSAASFKSNGRVGYIYILLASHDFEKICENLFRGYFSKLTLTTLLITSLLSLSIGFISIILISKSLLIIIHYVNKFKEGDLKSRIPSASTTNLSILATTFNEMADTISQNIEEIKSINAFKKELIANISHDLRTPLTLIRGYAETLNEKEILITEENRYEFLTIIEQSTLTLSNLVNQLYEYSNLDAKQLKPNKITFNICELLNDVVNRYYILSNKKKIKIKLDCKLDIQHFVYADKVLIDRVIQNILDNAIKFTPNGGNITIVLEDKNDRTIVKIKDSGQGIDDLERDLIFDRWFTSKKMKENKGLGLGLAIVKKIIELHGTSIMIHSEGKNKGCEFIFSLYKFEKLENQQVNVS
ncbi:sensor histidine kinase [Tenacibaculum agarivorans]|uniref:sensor histidine kinase n=1 Tax=Tenacibaculum agarivorans TaxID=1908389 RepID=UPI00094BC0D4|nr:HAMP domain-containing sensor histidine kinase [Tenacibaculum agarivorans]